jgi:hypothetical protein
MEYHKPEVILLESAVSAIQGGDKPHEGVYETAYPYQLTIGAYEADE